MSQLLPAAGIGHRRFLLQIGLVLPAVLAGTAVLLRSSGADDALTAAFYDGATRQFLVDHSGWLELIGHRIGRSLVQAAWLLLVAAALASPWVVPLRPYRRLMWTTAAAMALGPLIVTALKDINTHACPWSLKAFGGSADYSAHWFVPHALAGRCFPGGHAAGGFSLLALAFAGEWLGRPLLRAGGLALGLGVGLLFSLLRVAQGAHFMSHNLWSAAIDLWTAALVFSPMWWRRTGHGSSASSSSPSPSPKPIGAR